MEKRRKELRIDYYCAITMSGQSDQKHMVFLLNNGSKEMISSDTRELECLTLPHPKGTLMLGCS